MVFASAYSRNAPGSGNAQARHLTFAVELHYKALAFGFFIEFSTIALQEEEARSMNSRNQSICGR